MKPSDVSVGLRVRTTREFSGVPEGTEGIIDEKYYGEYDSSNDGFMVAWDKPVNDLPEDYKNQVMEKGATDEQKFRFLRDGFSFTELQYLEVVNDG